MKAAVLLALLALLTACATGNEPAEVFQRADGETWRYYPKQPFGRKVLVERVAPDGKLIAREQRLSEEYIARIVQNHTRKEEVRELFGAPYEQLTFPRLQRETWTWHMRQFGDQPASLNVQMSFDGVVREVYVLGENNKNESRKR